MDEISISVRLISLTCTIEEAVSFKLPILSLEFAVVFVSADVILEVGSRSVAVTFSETRVPTLVLG
ncbi:hypothetical protein F2Q69_00062329 [Brassica cretica]|uniref:Uncharacterized protein n=1 Tax=Brassica cretica TaxID=69181 RepID=A0A8S9RR74_BRACR|nr:hypothetical protein F2Q69_00062329 [Brassica cretica]